MTNAELDEVFAQHCNRLGMASMEQIDAAKRIQKENSERGAPISLADALVQIGALTELQMANVLKQIEVRKQGGIKQLGQYKLLKKLGHGAMGDVFLAEDTLLQRKVAIKILPKKHAENTQFLSRFRREAKAAGQLNHVNICGAFAVGEEHAINYYVMEYCEGQSVGQKIKAEGRIVFDEAVKIVIHVVHGLQYAHQHGFIHRDIKPDNVFLTVDGTVKILDMGLSKNILAGEDSNALTQTGTALGTPNYISPEQARGATKIDGRSDIYSLGAMFYHMLTGVTPFQGSNATAVIMKHLNEEAPNLCDANVEVPDGAAQIITRMMAKDPNERYADCGELLVDLERIVDARNPSTGSSTPAKASVAPPKEKRTVSDRFPPKRGGQRAGEKPAKACQASSGAGDRKKSGPNKGVQDGKNMVTELPAEPREEPAPDKKPNPPRPNRLPRFFGIGVGAAVLAVAGWFFFFAGKTGGRLIDSALGGLRGKAEKELSVDLGGDVDMAFVLIDGPNPSDPKNKLSKPFYVGRYEVTVNQFRRFAAATDLKQLELQLGLLQQECPVVNVDYKLAENFCKWESKQTGKTVRMPNELEWELACRAGAQTAYCSGDREEDLAEVAWYKRNSGEKPHPVGEKKPNAFGLYDMHGNVHELCLGIDGKGPLMRGGCYENWGAECRSDWRQKFPEDQRYKQVGFRVVMEP